MEKRDEILARSRAEGRDEMEVSINQKSSYIGIITLFLACFFFAATKVLSGEPFFELPAILFAYLAGTNFNNYHHLKKRSYLNAGIAWIFAFICMTIVYFCNR